MSSPTIIDVANACKVSPSTVSLTLNDNPRIPLTTKEKIRKKISELNYKPNLIARSLAKGKTQIIAVLIPPVENVFSDPFYSMALDGIYTIAKNNGYKIVLEVVDKSFWLKKEYEKLFADRLIEGVIFLGGIAREHRELHKLSNSYGYVLVGESSYIVSKSNKVPVVTGDNFKGGYLATKYLLSLGHRKIAHIHGDMRVFSVLERYRGFSRALKEFDIVLHKGWIATGKFREWDSYLQAKKIFYGEERPTAIFAGNDVMALGAIRAVNECGLKVPDDISVIGMDDIPLAATSSPPLTTVKYPIYAMASYATDALIKKVEGSDMRNIKKIFDVALVERQTTAILSRK